MVGDVSSVAPISELKNYDSTTMLEIQYQSGDFCTVRPSMSFMGLVWTAMLAVSRR